MRGWLAQSIELALTAVLVVCSVASCADDRHDIELTPGAGGPAMVLRDGAVPDGSANGAHGGKGGDGGKGGKAGSAGHGGNGGAGGRAGASGGGAGSGGIGTGGGGGGANGGAAQVDACRACELRRCTKPQNDDGNTIIAADFCFLDQAVSPNPPEIYGLCGTDALAARLTSSGKPKTDLCHAVLACFAKSKCAGPLGTDDFMACYCGPGVTSQQCQQVTFVPKGECAALLAAGYESTSNATITGNFYSACLASGAAANAYLGCYENCCPKECLGVEPSPNADDSYCNAPATNSGGTGGTTATGGTGATGTGGTVSTGGSGGSAAGGHGGSAGAAGRGGAGIGGGAPSSAVTHFNGATAPWTASYGSVVNYSTTDAAGSSTSGSLDLVLMNGSASTASLVAATECVSAVAGATYDLSAQIFLPQQMTGVFAGLGLWFYASNDCSSGLSTTYSSPQVAVVGSWTSLSTSSAVPAGTQSMSVRLTLTKPAGKTAAEALFDDVSVMKR